jgi:diamine N-acetyltransferase
MGMGEYRLEELNASNIVAANSLTMKPGQEQFIAPPSYAITEAYVNPTTAWPRVVVSGNTVVGFIRGNFDPENSHPEFRSCIWRINVAAEAQGQGVGTFAVHALADEARSRGYTRLTVLWEPGAEGPGAFFNRVGFKDVGTTPYGETIGELLL